MFTVLTSCVECVMRRFSLVIFSKSWETLKNPLKNTAPHPTCCPAACPQEPPHLRLLWVLALSRKPLLLTPIWTAMWPP